MIKVEVKSVEKYTKEIQIATIKRVRVPINLNIHQKDKEIYNKSRR